VSEATKAIVLNAVPLLVLAAAYTAVAAALLPALWRGRRRAHALDWALVLVFAGIAAAAAIFGVLVVHERLAFGGHVWVSLGAILAALVPALLLFTRWRDRAFVVGGIGRAQDAEDRVLVRDRELEVVTEISHALVRAHTPAAVAQPLVRQVTGLLGVGFAGVAVVSDDGRLGEGVYAELDGREPGWWRDVRLDLRNEPSGIANAVFDAAPVAMPMFVEDHFLHHTRTCARSVVALTRHLAMRGCFPGEAQAGLLQLQRLSPITRWTGTTYQPRAA